MASGVIYLRGQYLSSSSVGCSSVFAQRFYDLQHPYHIPFKNCHSNL